MLGPLGKDDKEHRPSYPFACIQCHREATVGSGAVRFAARRLLKNIQGR